MIPLLLALLQGPTPTIDGTLSPGEWESGRRFKGSGGMEVYVTRTDSAIWIGVRGAGDGFPHLALLHGDSVLLLHASAALGTATYAGSQNPRRLVRPFTFAVRAPGLDAAAIAERNAFFAREGWVASTIRMGKSGETEFKIARSLLGPDARFAITYWSETGGVQRWPATLDDAVSDPRMVQGFLSPEAIFHPEEWGQVE